MASGQRGATRPSRSLARVADPGPAHGAMGHKETTDDVLRDPSPCEGGRPNAMDLAGPALISPRDRGPAKSLAFGMGVTAANA